MGNMGHPVITRIGINQFWYRHWYSDTNYSNNLKQDNLFDKLVYLYLKYGLTFQNNPFFHEYWYRKTNKPVRTKFFTRKNIKFFRRFYYQNTTLSIEHSFLLRKETAEYFPLRTWILKYGNWVVVCVQWYKPMKGKNNTIRRARDKSNNSAALTRIRGRLKLKRLKLAYYYLLQKDSLVLKNYVF